MRWRGLAKVYFKGLGDMAAAQREIDAAFTLAAHDPSLWTMRGDFLHAKGEMRAAAAAYRKAVDGGVQDASLFAGYASALTNLRQYELAREMVDEALRIDDQNAIAHYNRGVILAQLGDTQEAATAYRASLELGPGNLLAYENLGELLAAQGAEEEAEAVFADGLKVAPEAPGLLYRLGSLHAKAGRYAQGIVLLEKSVAVRPNSAPARTNLGYAYHQLERYDDAIAQYEALTRIYPKQVVGYADAWLRMARLRAQQGRKKEAARLLEVAISAGGESVRKAAGVDPDLRSLSAAETRNSAK